MRRESCQLKSVIASEAKQSRFKIASSCFAFVSLGLAVLAMTLLFARVGLACPACKEAVASQGGTMTRAWASSIYLMMAVPYLLFAGLAFTIARSARRNKK